MGWGWGWGWGCWVFHLVHDVKGFTSELNNLHILKINIFILWELLQDNYEIIEMLKFR